MHKSFSTKLNILNIGTLPPHFGGSALTNAELISGLSHFGHSIRAIAPVKLEQLKRNHKDMNDNLKKVKIERYIFNYQSPSQPPSNSYLKKEYNTLNKVIQKTIDGFHPDVVIIGRESFCWYVPDLCQKWNRPSIMIAQGSPTSGLLEEIYPEHIRLQFIEQFKKIDFIITVSKHLEDILRQLGITNVHTIQNRVDTTLFSPGDKDRTLLNKLNIKIDDIVISHISRLTHGKRSKDVIQAAKLTLNCNKNLIYLIIGEGPVKREMEKMCLDYGVNNNFRFLGKLKFSDIPKYINLSDAVIIPSEHEGLARIYLETQACGKVVIASDIPPAREVICHGKTGLLFKKGDVQDLATKILDVANNSKLRGQMGLEARKQTIKYSFESWIHAYLDVLYRTLRYNQYCKILS